MAERRTRQTGRTPANTPLAELLRALRAGRLTATETAALVDGCPPPAFYEVCRVLTGRELRKLRGSGPGCWPGLVDFALLADLQAAARRRGLLNQFVNALLSVDAEIDSDLLHRKGVE